MKGHLSAYFDKITRLLKISFIPIYNDNNKYEYIHSIDCSKLFKIYNYYSEQFYKAIYKIFLEIYKNLCPEEIEDNQIQTV